MSTENGTREELQTTVQVLRKRVAILERTVHELECARRSRQESEELFRADEARRDARYRTLIQNLEQGVFLKDRDLRFAAVNRPFCESVGRAEAEVVGKTDFDLYPITLAERYRANDELVLRHGQRIEIEEEVLLRGRKRFQQVAKTPVRNEHGKIVGLLGICWDVTRQRELERQVRTGQRMESIGHLAGGVAHDFNNLLTVINGYSEMLLSGLGEHEEMREPLLEIRKAGERAAALTDQLLAFSRKQILQPVVVNLNTLVRDVEKLLRRLIGEDIRLQAQLDPEAGQVLVDPGQIEQVIVNLAVNARDAMPAGGDLVISTQNVDMDENAVLPLPGMRPGAFVLVGLADSGTGMSEEIKSHIFEPFYTTKAQGKGTGLGLAVVYGIIKQSNGCIYVDSERGKGTRFRIYLPRTEQKPAERKSVGQESTAVGGTETILLAEDEQEVRELARAALRTYGYQLLVAGSGEEAVTVAENHQGSIHLLVTDVVMPRMSGHQLSGVLGLQRPEMKTLFMSGYTDETIIRHGVAIEGVAFLHKPFSPLALARKVRATLDGGKK